MLENGHHTKEEMNERYGEEKKARKCISKKNTSPVLSKHHIKKLSREILNAIRDKYNLN